MSNVILVLALTAVGAGDGSTATKPGKLAREPLQQGMARETALVLEHIGQEFVIVRERTNGDVATFSAEPQLLERGTKMVIEVYTVAQKGSVLRFRCEAKNDVAECLGTPVRVHWLPSDEKAVLVARIVPDRRRPVAVLASS